MREARDLAKHAEALLDEAVAERRRLWSGLDLPDGQVRAVRRAVGYAIDCAASRIDDVVEMLADHEILPLVWTSDAYYICRSLLAVGPRDPQLGYVVADICR